VTEQTLTDFLLARWAETETMLLACVDPVELHGRMFLDTRALIRADFEAKRLIISDLCEWYSRDPESLFILDQVLRNLSLPYADHPEYRPVFRP